MGSSPAARVSSCLLTSVVFLLVTDAAPTAPACRSRGSESTEELGGLPAAELTAVQCKNIPDYLNDRTVLEKHFGQFAKVRRIMTRRNKKKAVLHFFDHVSIRSGRKFSLWRSLQEYLRDLSSV